MILFIVYVEESNIQKGKYKMSLDQIHSILHAASTDEDFRAKLSSDFLESIKDYDLDDDELEALKKVDWNNLPSGLKPEIPGVAAATWVHVYKATPEI